MDSTGTSLAHTELVTHLIHISSCLQQHLDHSCMTIYSYTIQWCLVHERDDIHNTTESTLAPVTATLHPYNGFMPSHTQSLGPLHKSYCVSYKPSSKYRITYKCICCMCIHCTCPLLHWSQTWRYMYSVSMQISTCNSCNGMIFQRMHQK